MKRQIITCLIVFIIGTIISGCYNVIALQKNFFTVDVFVEGAIDILAYLLYYWINTKWTKKTKRVCFFIACFLVVIVMLTNREVSYEFTKFNWKTTMRVTLYTIYYFQTKSIE